MELLHIVKLNTPPVYIRDVTLQQKFKKKVYYYKYACVRACVCDVYV